MGGNERERWLAVGEGGIESAVSRVEELGAEGEGVIRRNVAGGQEEEAKAFRVEAYPAKIEYVRAYRSAGRTDSPFVRVARCI